jgi:hypothetical protein
MKVLLVHLSDIHIKNANDEIFKRFASIKGAILSVHHNIEKCILIISGDIAFSGSQDQYLLATDLILKLREELENEGIDFEIEIIPGNHDCDFKDVNNNGTRNMTITQLKHDMDNIDDSIVNTTTKIQNNFYEFYSMFKSDNIDNKIFYKNSYTLNQYKINFHCLNTAWISTIDEQYGDLVYPLNLVKEDFSIEHKDGLVITLLHHPYNWFNYENRKLLKKNLEEISDIIITGHEHDGNLQIIEIKSLTEEVKEICINIDDTVVTILGNQEGSAVGYNARFHGRPSFKEKVSFIAGANELLDITLESGKHHNNYEFLDFFKNCTSQFPKRYILDRVRLGRGLFDEKNFSYFEYEGIEYVSKSKILSTVKVVISHINNNPKDYTWNPISSHFDTTEITVPLPKWERARRFVIVRERLEPRFDKKQLMFEELSYSYEVIVTSTHYLTHFMSITRAVM